MNIKPIIVPDFSSLALSLSANGHLAAGRTPEALDLLTAAVAMQPKNLTAVNEMGNALKSAGQHMDALAFYAKSQKLAPHVPEVYMNIGATLLDVGDMAGAIANLRHALFLNPNLHEARWNLAITLLCSGHMIEGWEQGRGRFATDRFQRHMPPYARKLPRWEGESDAKVLVWGEQGQGERIMYAPWVQRLTGLCAEVWCDCDPRFIEIFERSYPGIRFVPWGDVIQPGGVTHQIAMGDLGERFAPSEEIMTKERLIGGYLRAKPRAVRALKDRLEAARKGRKIVGLSWRSANVEYGGHKSMTLFDLVPMIEREDMIVINLQYGDTRAERGALAAATGLEILTLPGVDLRDNIDAVAAVMCACDVVVSVSNTHAHLAGALGVKTFVALPKHNARFWYWFLDRCDSPWYSSARLYRQTRHGRWGNVVQKIVEDITALPAGKDAQG